MTDATKPTLTPVAQKFILHWGEMGTKWGINRTVAQVHALLFLSPHPLPADEISATLSVARSNVSTSLRELQGWGIVSLVHVLGDRRDHFQTTKDVWEIFRTVSEEKMPHVYVEGIGLSNVRERLRVLYGEDFQLDIESREGQGTTIRIDVPELAPAIPEVSVF